MELADFLGKPCKSKTAYEFLPKKKVKIDLEKASVELSTVGTIELRSKVLVMSHIDNAVVSLFASGKLLVRGEREEELARKIAQKAVSVLKESIK